MVLPAQHFLARSYLVRLQFTRSTITLMRVGNRTLPSFGKGRALATTQLPAQFPYVVAVSKLSGKALPPRVITDEAGWPIASVAMTWRESAFAGSKNYARILGNAGAVQWCLVVAVLVAVRRLHSGLFGSVEVGGESWGVALFCVGVVGGVIGRQGVGAAHVRSRR